MKIKLTRWLSFLWVMAMTVAASAGNMVTVGAKAEKGQVFAGWYLDAERTVPYALGGVDYRTAQMTYAPDETDTLFSRFATEAEDKDSIDFDLSLNPYYNSNAPLAIPLSGAVKSLSLPTLTVANLPTGVKYDAKTLSLTGTPTKPGETKDVKFTIKNLSDKAGKVFTRTFKIGDAQAASLPELHYNDANGYPAFTPGAAVDMANVLGAATMATLAEGGWTITGLPAGMTFKNGVISGAPTAANTSYLVTFKKGSGASAETATITLRTGALPKLTIATNIVDSMGQPVVDPAVLKQVKVTGAGAYAANKAVSLGATAPKGWVFAGWHQNGECSVPAENGTQDFRTASGYKIVMPVEDTTLTALFIPVFADYASVADVDEYGAQSTVWLWQGDSMPAGFIKDAVDSGSFPMVTVNGLPAGIKFDAKSLLLSGAATDKTAKWYDLIVTVKNAAGYTFTGVFGVSVNGGEPAVKDEIGEAYGVDFSVMENMMVGARGFGDFGDEDDGEIPIPSNLKVQVSSLPAGLYLEREEQEWEYGGESVMCDSVLGVTIKPGVYYTTFKATDPSTRKTLTTVVRSVVRDMGSIYVTPRAMAGGTVTGEGLYAGGASLKLVAKASANYVFAHWLDGEGNVILSDDRDYRDSTLLDIVSARTFDEYTAVFVPKSEDGSVSIHGWRRTDEYDYEEGETLFAEMADDDPYFDYDQSDYWSRWYFEVESASLPVVTVTGLPSGVKFAGIDEIRISQADRSRHLLYRIKVFEGSNLAPGEYNIKVGAKNQSGAMAEKTFVIRVPNYRNPSLPLEYDNGYTLVPGATVDADALGLGNIDLRGWTVTGLPAGMKFDSKTGQFSGAPTTPDTPYTVWFKKTGEGTATVTMRTKPYPELVLKVAVFRDESVDVEGPFEGDWYDNPHFETDSAILTKFKVTGSGNHAAGKVVSLGATAPTDYVFCGWCTKDGAQGYDPISGDVSVRDGDILNPRRNGCDCRLAAYTLVMPTNDVTELYGVFMPKSYDWCTRGGIYPEAPDPQWQWATDSQLAVDGVVLHVGDDVAEVLGGTYVRDLFYSDSFPTITAANLPTGMKFDAKSLLVSGKITAQPGYFYATFTAKNVSGYTFTRPVKFIVRAADSKVDPVDTVNVDTLTDGNGGNVYTFWLDNLKVGTGVGANIPEGDEYDWLRDDEDEVADYEIYCGEGSSSYGIQSISGLPPGLKVVKETETSGSYTYYYYSIEGVPTTPGWYTVTINAKDFEGRACKLVKRVPVFDMPDDWIDVEVAEGCEAMGTVTGGGLVTAGKTFTITATPKAGYAFAGWYRQDWSFENMSEVSEVLVPVTNMSYNTAWKFYDWRDPSQVWMNDANCPWQFVAKFIPKAEATGETIVSVTSYETWDEMAGGYVYPTTHKLAEPVPLEGFNWVIQPASSSYSGDVLDLDLSFDAATLPKVTISGLPKGFDATHISPLWGGQGFLEFDNGVDASSGPEPGDYPVTLTIVNQGVTTKVNFTITIGQYHSWEMDQAGLQTAYSVDVGETSDDWVAALGITGDLTSGRDGSGGSWTWSVTGLPKGLSFNKTTGKITGKLAAVTADTTSIVHIKKTSTYPGSGTFTEEATTAITVKALPSWLVGTFYGSAAVFGGDWEWPNGIEVKVAASGAVTATVVDADGVKTTVTSSNVYRDESENFRFDFDGKFPDKSQSSGSCVISKAFITEETPLGYLSGIEEGVDEDDDDFICEWAAYQDAYSAKPDGVALPTFAANDSTLTIDVAKYSTMIPDLGPLEGELTLKFGTNASGAVTPTWSGDAPVAMVAAHMTPILVNDEFALAKLWVMGYSSAVDGAIGFNIDLMIPHNDGAAKASEVHATITQTVICPD